VNAHRLLALGDPLLSTGAGLEAALSQIAVATLSDPVARSFAADVVAACAVGPAVLDRSWRPSHLTASALVVDATATQTLLLLHRKLGRWLQPGGHVDGDGNLAAAALREASEETGIEGLRVVFPAVDVDIHRVAPPAESAHDHLDVRFVVVAPPGAAAVGNHESLGLRWVRESELGDLGVDDGLHRLVRVGFAVARDVLA